MKLNLVFAATLVAVWPAFASPVAPATVPHNHVVFEKRSSAPSHWVKRDRLHPQQQVEMRIALTPSGLDEAHDWLMDISDPTSVNYGKHWTAEQVWDAFKPSEEALQAIHSWLAEAGLNTNSVHQTANHAWLKLTLSANAMERLLHTSFHEFEHSGSKGRTIACDQYHIPEHLAKHIDYITPGIQLDRLQYRDGAVKSATGSKRPSTLKTSRRVNGERKNSHHRPMPRSLSFANGKGHATAQNFSGCHPYVTPACIKALYQITEPAPSTPHPNNSMGIYETAYNQYNQENLNTFFSALAPWIPNGTAPFNIGIDGGVAETSSVNSEQVETTLDLDMALPILYPQNATIFQENNIEAVVTQQLNTTWLFEEMLDAFDGSYCTYKAYGQKGNPYGPHYPDPTAGYNGTLQCGGLTPPNVISISYEAYEGYLPLAFQKRQCNEYLKLGLQGVSFVFSSGDIGVGIVNPPAGLETYACLGTDQNVFSPSSPSSCPYVTSVGGTMLPLNSTGVVPETVWNFANESPTGGFSNLHAMPSYQKAAVDAYFASYAPPYEYYCEIANVTSNTSYLDVNALQNGNSAARYNRAGRGFPDVSANAFPVAIGASGGITFSGGTSAATPIFASIINRINEHRLNSGKKPLGFLNPALYKNPSMFNDITTGHNTGCNTTGFSAVPGWDPVTGLGTPNFPKMKEYFMSLP